MNNNGTMMINGTQACAGLDLGSTTRARVALAEHKRADTMWVFVTPDLARFLLGTSQGNRPLKPIRIARYRRHLAQGEWAMTGQGIIIDSAGHLIDGHHRLTAVIAEKTSAWVLVVFGVDPEAKRHLDQNSVRQPADTLQCVNRVAVAAALGWLWRESEGGKSGNMPANETPTNLEQHPTMVECVHVALKLRFIIPPSLGGYMVYRTRQANSNKSQEFIEQLASGTLLKDGSPVLLLRNRLMANRAGKSKLPQHEVLALIIKAWRSFLEGRPLRSLKWRTNPERPEPMPVWP